MRTNAAEVEELRAQIRNMELQASEAASLHETEVKHLQSAHRAETMSARVKINQLTGEVATLRESAGSSKHEIQGLLKKVSICLKGDNSIPAMQGQRALNMLGGDGATSFSFFVIVYAAGQRFNGAKSCTASAECS